MIKWKEVARTHGSWRGVSMKEGRVVSILCSQHKDGGVPDTIREDKIEYAIPTTTNYLARERKALEAMIGSGFSVHVFEKLGRNAWEDHGLWIVKEKQQKKSVDLFILKRESKIR